MFQGTITALVTPFKRSAADVDLDGLERLIEWQIASGVDGIVLCGTTGEAATLSDEEKVAIFKRGVQVVAKRIPLIAGTGTNDTKHSVELSQEAKRAGVDGVLAVTPYYNKPTQEGQFQHFRAIAEQGGLPVVVYNIPGRTAVETQPDTFRRLAAVPGIVAVKQAVDSVVKLLEIAAAVDGKMALLAGDDPLTHAVFSVGGKGVISATASVLPELMLAITRPGLKGDMAACLRAQQEALEQINAMFLETNPAPAKAVLKMMGLIEEESLRLPLVPVGDATRSRLTQLFGSFRR